LAALILVKAEGKAFVVRHSNFNPLMTGQGQQPRFCRIRRMSAYRVIWEIG
jgi:hypothetical protein